MDIDQLLDERRAALTHNTAIQADQLIQNWIEDVRFASSHGDDLSTQSDFLSSVDWLHGDVSNSAKVIVQGLMTKNLDVAHHSPSSKSHDPRVAMEMRHIKVRERRVARDHRRAKVKERESLAKEARRQAKDLVMREERQAREKRLKEEQLISHQMKQIRSELREKERISRLVVMETPPSMNVMTQAELFLKSERKRQHTRSELVRQLDEIEVSERKDNYKLMYACFSRWLHVVVEGRGKLAKAAAVCDWRLVVRVWGVWRGWVGQCRVRREREEAARMMQRQRILYQRAISHNRVHVLSKAVRTWLAVVRRSQTQLKEKQVQALYRRKMDALLQSAKLRVDDIEPTNDDDDGEKQVQEVVSRPVEPLKTTPAVSQPIIWKKAKKEMAQLMSEVEASTSDTKVDTPKQPVKPSMPSKVLSKPTKPVTVSGMEKRSLALAQRRASREARRLAREKEKLETLAREETERVRVETEQRRVREAQRREEKQAAKQREADRELRRRQLSELTAKATHHYRCVQLKARGLIPWTSFIVSMREARELADKVRGQTVIKKTLSVWRAATVQRSLAREKMADELFVRQSLRKCVNHWKQFVIDSMSLDELALTHRPKLLTRRVLRAWVRVTCDERVRGWEMLTKARRFRERHLKVHVLSAWIQFVPLSKEERAHEVRRADLRRKVASWLHDYTPHNS